MPTLNSRSVPTAQTEDLGIEVGDYPDMRQVFYVDHYQTPAELAVILNNAVRDGWAMIQILTSPNYVVFERWEEIGDKKPSTADQESPVA